MNNKLSYVLVIFAVFYIISKSSTTSPTIMGQWDITADVDKNGYSLYLAETSDFDYMSEKVYALAVNIKSNTATPKEAVKDTMRYVAQNIRYDSDVDIDYCYEEKASTVLEVMQGDCVSMSRLVTALLRAQGIPARTMGGCLTSQRCVPLFASVPYLKEPQVTPMVEGDYKKRVGQLKKGFLHEWVEYWIPENDGWQIVESTSGQSFDISCATYLPYSYDSNKFDRCIINSQEFWMQCKQS